MVIIIYLTLVLDLINCFRLSLSMTDNTYTFLLSDFL